MNKKRFISYILFSFALFTHFTKSNARTKIRDNYLYFTHHAHSVSFTVKRHCITPGQPYQTPDGNYAQKTSHGVGIDIKAGRHGSRNVVDCVLDIFKYTNDVPFSNQFTFARYSNGDHPARLNFATEGSLTIDGKTFDDIILAQGHDGASNNWWFGGVNCLNASSPVNDAEQVDCLATDGTDWCFIRGATAHGFISPNHVEVEKLPCRLTIT